jgi:hypothetical protein
MRLAATALAGLRHKTIRILKRKGKETYGQVLTGSIPVLIQLVVDRPYSERSMTWDGNKHKWCERAEVLNEGKGACYDAEWQGSPRINRGAHPTVAWGLARD